MQEIKRRKFIQISEKSIFEKQKISKGEIMIMYQKIIKQVKNII